MAKRLAHDLPEDLLDEVVNEVFLLLLRCKPTFDRSRATVGGFLLLFMKNALRLVRARYAAPGTAKRARCSGKSSAAHTCAVDAMAEESSLVDARAQRAMEARVAANEALASAESQVRAGLWLVHVSGHTITEAAERLSVSRFTLARAMDRFARAAVAA